MMLYLPQNICCQIYIVIVFSRFCLDGIGIDTQLYREIAAKIHETLSQNHNKGKDLESNTVL